MQVPQVAPLRRCPAREAREGDRVIAERVGDHLQKPGVLDSASEEQPPPPSPSLYTYSILPLNIK